MEASIASLIKQQCEIEQLKAQLKATQERNTELAGMQEDSCEIIAELRKELEAAKRTIEGYAAYHSNPAEQGGSMKYVKLLAFCFLSPLFALTCLPLLMLVITDNTDGENSISDAFAAAIKDGFLK